MLEATKSPKNVVLTSANHRVIHSHQSFQLLPDNAEEEPDFGFLQVSLGSLLLSTALALFSAYDAKNQCQSIEAYDVYEEFEGDDATEEIDENNRFQEQILCEQMFLYVMIPVVATVCICGSLSLWILQKHSKHLSDNHLDRMEKYTLHYWACLRLSILFTFIVAAWTYGTIAIMLTPRDTDSENSNPYLSLAAVDSMGHVSDNANLYYTTWISLGLSIALIYQSLVDTVRQRRRRFRERFSAAVAVGDVEAMLSSLTVYQLETYRESRATWYQSLYRLRIRTGIWSATLMATLLVMASSVHIWKQVLIPTARKLHQDTKFRNVCSNLVESSLPQSLCARTGFSLFSGMIAACLSFGAVVMHLLARRGAAQFVEKGRPEEVCAPSLSVPEAPDSFGGTFLPLKWEFLLAVILSNLLGLNAIFATGVHGPAASVGNLYYASWIGFLLCLRICLGCLEELVNIDQEGHDQIPKNRFDHQTYSGQSVDGSELSNRLNASIDDAFSTTTDLMENERAQRTRKYLFLGICSTVFSASAFDAAINQANELNAAQEYVIFAPSLVAVICACLFMLCLHKKTYFLVSQVWFGGVLSVLVFGTCLATLIITMHSPYSWAVNAIGEIKIANLYYFAWASILTAGLQMMSYLRKWLGLTEKDYLTVVWVAVAKVCFVILGAGFHIWHNIGGACSAMEDMKSGAVTFCARTVFAIVVAFTGMFVSGFVAFFRFLYASFCHSSTTRSRAHVEMVISLFLVMLFGAAVGLITGIGGPGQSVGDMFYATWLAFLVAIGLMLVTFEEVRRLDSGDDAGGSHPSVEDAHGGFVQMT
jgi:hypothetical protein